MHRHGGTKIVAFEEMVASPHSQQLKAAPLEKANHFRAGDARQSHHALASAQLREVPVKLAQGGARHAGERVVEAERFDITTKGFA